MTHEEFFQSIQGTYNASIAIIRQKNNDYASIGDPFKNFDYASLLGVSPELAILVRVVDKLARIHNLLDKPAMVADETVADTLVDAIGYLAILKAKLESRSVGATAIPSVGSNSPVTQPVSADAETPRQYAYRQCSHCFCGFPVTDHLRESLLCERCLPPLAEPANLAAAGRVCVSGVECLECDRLEAESAKRSAISPLVTKYIAHTMPVGIQWADGDEA